MLVKKIHLIESYDNKVSLCTGEAIETASETPGYTAIFCKDCMREARERAYND